MANLIVPYSRRHDAEIDRKRFPCAAWRQKEPQTLFLVRHDAEKASSASLVQHDAEKNLRRFFLGQA